MDWNELLATNPETVIAKNSQVTGDIKFNYLLRIDGNAKGTIFAPIDSNLVISKCGAFHGNIEGIGSVYIDGKIQGNVKVCRLFLGSHAVIRGNISCQSLSMAGTASIIGKLHVSPNLVIEANLANTHLVKEADMTPKKTPPSSNQLEDSLHADMNHDKNKSKVGAEKVERVEAVPEVTPDTTPYSEPLTTSPTPDDKIDEIHLIEDLNANQHEKEESINQEDCGQEQQEQGEQLSGIALPTQEPVEDKGEPNQDESVKDIVNLAQEGEEQGKHKEEQVNDNTHSKEQEQEVHDGAEQAHQPVINQPIKENPNVAKLVIDDQAIGSGDTEQTRPLSPIEAIDLPSPKKSEPQTTDAAVAGPLEHESQPLLPDFDQGRSQKRVAHEVEEDEGEEQEEAAKEDEGAFVEDLQPAIIESDKVEINAEQPVEGEAINATELQSEEAQGEEGVAINNEEIIANEQTPPADSDRTDEALRNDNNQADEPTHVDVDEQPRETSTDDNIDLDHTLPKEQTSEAEESLPQENKEQEKEEKGQNWLFIYEPQIDFYPGGQWCSSDTSTSTLACVQTFLTNNMDRIHRIVVFLDMHYGLEPEDSTYWKNAKGEVPDVGTIISLSDIDNGTWQIADPEANREMALAHIKTLLEPHKLEDTEQAVPAQFLDVSIKKGLVIRPPHCQVGGSGAAVMITLQRLLSQWVNLHNQDVVYVMSKHPKDFVEEHQTNIYDVSFAAQISPLDQIILCGQMNSHCQRCALTDIIQQLIPLAQQEGESHEEIGKRIHVLSDGVAEVGALKHIEHSVRYDVEKDGNHFYWHELRALGVKVVAAKELIL